MFIDLLETNVHPTKRVQYLVCIEYADKEGMLGEGGVVHSFMKTRERESRGDRCTTLM